MRLDLSDAAAPAMIGQSWLRSLEANIAGTAKRGSQDFICGRLSARSGMLLSDHFVSPQRADLVGGEAELGKDFLGLFAEFRRGCCHFARRPR
jgi:hypothetical protein